MDKFINNFYDNEKDNNNNNSNNNDSNNNNNSNENNNDINNNNKRLQIVKGDSKTLNISKVKNSLPFEIKEDCESPKEKIIVPKNQED